MSRAYRHSIYKLKPKVVIRQTVSSASSVPYCYNPCPNLLDTFLALEQQIFLTEQALQQYYQPNRAVSEFVAKMTGRAFVHPQIFVRLAWRQLYDGVRFDITNAIHRLQIKDIYLQYGFDYTTDPLFKDALGLTLV